MSDDRSDMFERFEILPPDPILGLIGRFRDDPSPDKVDLGVGVYRDESGNTPVMAAVRRAERDETDAQTSKAYFGQAGNPAVNPLIEDLVLGESHPARADDRVRTLQTPGGSGALRIAAELLLASNPQVTVWVPTPTWANHTPLIGAAGVALQSYPYYAAGAIDREAMLSALDSVPKGDVILLHAACHNPTGADLTPSDWESIVGIAEARGVSLLVDSAYQGFAEGLDTDAAGARLAAESGVELLLATSFSKNFGLYRDRAGALSVSGPSAAAVHAAYSNALRLVRTMYSVPPDHGPAVVGRILTDPSLRAEWQSELDHMRGRLVALRGLLADALAAGHGDRFDFIRTQRGMFSLLGIEEREAVALVDDFHIYLPSNGRINVAGLHPDNVGYVAEAISKVVSG